MPATATVTINVKDILGVNYSGRRTPITVRTNIPDETIVEKSSGNLRVGTGRVTMDESSGVATVEVWVPGSDTNPASWQTYFDIEYEDRAARAKKRKTYGPFTITGDVDLGDLIEEQAVPPTYLSQVTQAIDAKVAEAEAAAAQAVDISNIDTPDSLVATLVSDSGSATGSALSASYEGKQGGRLRSKAKADGSTDDRNVIQAEMDALSAYGGGILELPPGTIMVRSKLWARSKVHVTGNGVATVLTSDTNIVGGLFEVQPTGGPLTNLEFSKLTFLGGAVDDAPDPRRSRTYSPSFDNAILIRAEGGTVPTQPKVTDVAIRDCYFYNVESLPTFLDGVKGESRVESNHYYNCLDPGFTFCDSAIFNNNWVRRGADNGVSLSRGCRMVTCVGNNIESVAYNGIWIAGFLATTGPTSVVVVGNTVRDCGLVGIQAKDAPKNVLIASNFVEKVRRGPSDERNDSGGAGIKVAGFPDLNPPYTEYAENVYVVGNLIVDPYRAGIQVRGGAKDVFIEGNTIINPGTEFLADGSSVINSFSTTDNYGIGVAFTYASSVTGLSIRNNKIIDKRATPFGNYDIVVNGVASPDVVGNYSRGMRRPPHSDTSVARPVFVPATTLYPVVGTPTLGHTNRWMHWDLDASAQEMLSGTTLLPADWVTFAVDVVWVNHTGGTGDVVWRLDQTTRGVGESMAGPGVGANVTATAGPGIQSTQLVTGAPNTGDEFAVLNVLRAATDAADTLAADVGVVGLRLRRTS